MNVEVLYAPRLYRSQSHTKDFTVAVVRYADHLKLVRQLERIAKLARQTQDRNQPEPMLVYEH